MNANKHSISSYQQEIDRTKVNHRPFILPVFHNSPSRLYETPMPTWNLSSKKQPRSCKPLRPIISYPMKICNDWKWTMIRCTKNLWRIWERSTNSFRNWRVITRNGCTSTKNWNVLSPSSKNWDRCSNRKCLPRNQSKKSNRFWR